VTDRQDADLGLRESMPPFPLLEAVGGVHDAGIAKLVIKAVRRRTRSKHGSRGGGRSAWRGAKIAAGQMFINEKRIP